MSPSTGSVPRIVLLLLGAVAPVLVGCPKQYLTNPDIARDGLPKAKELLVSARNINVVIVAPEITIPPNPPKHAITFPDRQLIYSGQYAVVWVGDGKKLSLTFENPAITPTCEAAKPICYIQPLTLPYGSYKYRGELTDAQDRVLKFDPHLEVVK
jgi:hypothetical protein